MLDDREKPYGWNWQENASILNVPGLTGPQERNSGVMNCLFFE